MSAKRNIPVFLFFFITVFLVYLPAQDAKFINDTFYYLYEIDTTGWKGILHSYHMIFIWYLPSLAYCILFKLFGLHWLGWHIAFCALHSLNALLLFRMLKKIFRQQPSFISYTASLLFLISPFQTEVVAWGGALHYLMIVTFLLAGMLALIAYFENGKVKHIVYYHVLFICSLSCFEHAFLFPFVYGLWVLCILPDFEGASRKKTVKVFIIKFLSINILSLVGYFLLTKIIFGTWIAHYGASMHTHFSLMSMYECFINYNLKFLFYYRDLHDVFKKSYTLYSFHSSMLIAFPVILLILAVWFYKKAGSGNNKILVLFVLSYVWMLVPVLNLDQSFNFEIQSDRYGYIASVFFYPLLMLVGYLLLHRILFYIFCAFQLTVSIVLLIHSVHLWHRAGDISMSLIRNYPLQPSQKAYLVNLPDNYDGAYMFRNGFNEGLSVVHHKDYKNSAATIAWVNIFTKGNESVVEKLNDSTYYVKCIHDGKWYYYLGHGAIDYQNENYRVDFDEWNTAYTWTLTSMPADTSYVLQCYGEQWKIADTLRSH